MTMRDKNDATEKKYIELATKRARPDPQPSTLRAMSFINAAAPTGRSAPIAVCLWSYEDQSYQQGTD